MIKKTYNLLFVDDSQNQLVFTEKLLKANFPNIKVNCEKNIYSLFSSRYDINDIDILVLDFYFIGFELKDDKSILDMLEKYRGNLIIFSSCTKKYIDKYIKLEFTYISKSNPQKLIDEVNKFLVRKI